MRLKKFATATVAEAMGQIRDALGDDAVIVSTQTDKDGEGVVVTAALEARDAEDELAQLLSGDGRIDLKDTVARALDFHNVPSRSIDLILDAARLSGADDPTAALSAALKAHFRFRSLTLKSMPRPVMMIGPPGVGKSLTAAKIATRAVLANRPVRMISTDGHRPGALGQLAAYSEVLEIDLCRAEEPSALRKSVAEPRAEVVTIIDSAGVNPFDGEEMGALAALVACAPIEPILVMPAGADMHEAADIAESFRPLGVERFIATRLDAARRLGALLATAAGGPAAFSEVSFSARAARGLKSLSALSLARLFMRDPDKTDLFYAGREVAR